MGADRDGKPEVHGVGVDRWETRGAWCGCK